MKILYFILLIPSLSLGHANDTAQQFSQRIAAQQLYEEYCSDSEQREVDAYFYISKKVFTVCQVCDVFESMMNGDELLSDGELQQNYCRACINHYAKKFKSPEDSEQLISFCSEQARDFVRIVRSSVNYTLRNEDLPYI